MKDREDVLSDQDFLWVPSGKSETHPKSTQVDRLLIRSIPMVDSGERWAGGNEMALVVCQGLILGLSTERGSGTKNQMARRVLRIFGS